MNTFIIKNFCLKSQPFISNFPYHIYQNYDYFYAYLDGGRLWPQKRMVSVLYMLNDICNHEFYFQDINIFNNFLKIELTENNLCALRKIMLFDHNNYGINNNKYISNEILQLEFLKSQLGVKNILLAYKNNRISNYTLKNPNWDFEKLNLNEKSINLNDKEKLQFKNIIVNCSNTIKNNYSLAKIYRLTFYDNLNHHKQEFLNLLELESLNFENDMEQLRKKIVNKIIEKIIINVNDEFSNLNPFFIYDRDYVNNKQIK